MKTPIASALLWAVTSLGTAPAYPPSTSPAPVPAHPLHNDPAALEQGLLETLRAYVRKDVDGMHAGLKKMDAACRAVGDEPLSGFPSEVVTHDRAYHKVVATCDDWATKGDLDQFLEAYLWLARSCGRCHAVAEKSGVRRP